MITYELIETQADFDKWAKALLAAPPLALGLDFECESNRYRYGIHLCLIQVTDGQQCWVIDPMVVPDISLFGDVLQLPHTFKVIYAASFDTRVLWHTHNMRMSKLFDLQVAGRLLNAKRFNLPNLLDDYLHIEFKKNNKLQKANWNKRPLKRDLLQYAVRDIYYLLPLFDAIREAAQAQQLLPILGTYFREIEQASFQEHSQPHLTVKQASRLTRRQQSFLKEYYELRESIAQELDYPPHYILANKSLIDIAKNPPKRKADWKTLKGLSGQAKRWLSDWQAATERAKKCSQ